MKTRLPECAGMSLEQSRGRSVRVREEAARPEPLDLELAARLEAKTQTRDEGRDRLRDQNLVWSYRSHDPHGFVHHGSANRIAGCRHLPL